ncbi:MAG TPA: M56 family metallopeptidase, partial [Bryobacteraceae bacterium]|nr:M56 family metallopeptidase [Bryobacteraceae bacterium]
MTELLQLINDAATAALIAWLNTIWAAVTAAAAVFACTSRSRRLNAATRHALWWAVAAFVITVPLLYGTANRAKPPQPAELPASMAAGSDAVTPVVPAPVSAAADSRPLLLLPALPWDWNAGRVPLAMFGVWLVLFTVQMVRVASSYRWLGRLKREARAAPARLRGEFDEWVLATAVRRPVRLLVSDAIESPVAVGFRDAAVILPASIVDGLEQQDIDHVLLHELAHIARRDDWTNLLARLLTGALAMNPVALFVLRRIDREREIACDDWVVAATGAAREYAASLSRLIEFRLARRRMLLASGVAGRGTQISDRISLLLESGRDFAGRMSPVGMGGALLALTILLAVCTVAPPWIVSGQEAVPAAP